MPSIYIDSCDDLPYGPGQTDYEYDKWRQEQVDMEEELKAQIRKLAEKAWHEACASSSTTSIQDRIESAILEGIALVLERHCAKCIAELDKAGIASTVGFNRETTRQIVRAMTAELLRELREGR